MVRGVWRRGALPAAGAFFERAATLLEQRAGVKNKFLGINTDALRAVDNFVKAKSGEVLTPKRQGVIEKNL